MLGIGTDAKASIIEDSDQGGIYAFFMTDLLFCRRQEKLDSVLAALLADGLRRKEQFTPPSILSQRNCNAQDAPPF